MKVKEIWELDVSCNSVFERTRRRPTRSNSRDVNSTLKTCFRLAGATGVCAAIALVGLTMSSEAFVEDLPAVVKMSVQGS